MLRQIIKVEVYLREVIQVVSEVLILTKKEARRMCICWGMRARKFKIGMNKWSCYLLSQVSWVRMLGTTLDYFAKLGPPAITIEVFLRKESDGTRFSKFTTKWWKVTSSMAVIPSLEKYNILLGYYCKLFSSGYPLAQHSIPLLSTGTTLVPPFWSWR